MNDIDLTVEVTPFATIGDLMGGRPMPPWWRPLARRRWIRLMQARVECEIDAHEIFVHCITRGIPMPPRELLPDKADW
jgi:hypothetical protein